MQTTGSDLLRVFPLEIRENIYAHLLAMGHLAIMRAARYTYEEAKVIRYRHAVYRADIVQPFRVEGGPVNVHVGNMVQNVDLRMHTIYRTDTWYDPYMFNADHIFHAELAEVFGTYSDGGRYGFAGSQRKRRMCCVTLMCDGDGWIYSPLIHTITVFRDFTGFELLVVRFEIDADPREEESIMVSNTEYAVARVACGLDVAKGVLERTLGPAKKVGSGLERSLEFQPQKFQEAQTAFRGWLAEPPS